MTTAVSAPRRGLRGLAVAVLVPLACAAVLTALLSSYVIAGGGGTITRVRIEVRLAAITVPSFTAQPTARGGEAATFLVIRNLSAVPEELVSASSPAAARLVLTRHGTAAGGLWPAGRGVRIPAHGSITLTPFGLDLVLLDPAHLQVGQTVLLTLKFGQAPTVYVDATVTPPGTP